MSEWERLEPGLYDRLEQWTTRSRRRHEVRAVIERSRRFGTWHWGVWFNGRQQDRGTERTLAGAKRAGGRAFGAQVRVRRRAP